MCMVAVGLGTASSSLQAVCTGRSWAYPPNWRSWAKCKLLFLAKVAGARIRNLKTMPKKKMRSNEEAHLCTQHQGKNMTLEAHLMAFLNFNVLETWIN